MGVAKNRCGNRLIICTESAKLAANCSDLADLGSLVSSASCIETARGCKECTMQEVAPSGDGGVNCKQWSWKSCFGVAELVIRFQRNHKHNAMLNIYVVHLYTNNFYIFHSGTFTLLKCSHTQRLTMNPTS